MIISPVFKKKIIDKPAIASVLLIASSFILAACNETNIEAKTNKVTNKPLVQASASSLIKATTVIPSKPLTFNYSVEGNLTKKLTFDVVNPSEYASISLYANENLLGNHLLIDHLNIPQKGKQQVNALVKFNQLGYVQLTIKVNNADLLLTHVIAEDVQNSDLPIFKDISEVAGIDKVSSIKYGGPTIADLDNDGDYDFIVNNHNKESSKIYWNNGDGTVKKHSKDLARWYMHDLHGTAAGDYDNDGDLDLVVTMGGGNGKNPSKANFYTNKAVELTLNENEQSSDKANFVLTTGDVGIDRGGRGRGAKWSDMDLDGDLDLMLINETSLHGDKPQHFFHENLGDGTFQHKPIVGLQDQHQSRALITDLNNDNIDDVILYGPLSVWQGNGDFTFTEITHKFSQDIASLKNIMAVVDTDIDNDGDFDLYLARGKEFELGKDEGPSVDHDPITKEFSIKPRGYKGIDSFEFTADGNLHLTNYVYLAQGGFRGKDYPIFLGSNKKSTVVSSGGEMEIKVDEAQGWPDDISENGVYFGHIGKGVWKSALVRNGDIFWSFKFTLSGVNSVSLDFEPANRNIADVLLRNDGDKFTDITEESNIPKGGNAFGVTTGDFNNDSHQDLFVYRWGNIGARISDNLLLNNGKGQFNAVTMHGANDVGGPGNGDMGQAFDFDLDGDVDLLNGSENGEWYLYENQYQLQANRENNNNYVLVNVGYSPKFNVDAISAEVIVQTKDKVYRKRVGSAGAIFSQSLLNIVHFGLGSIDRIESIQVRWRNGETVNFTDKAVNSVIYTDKLDPTSLSIASQLSSTELASTEQDTTSVLNIRQGSSINVELAVKPTNADKAVTWSTSNNNILTVDTNGMVTAVGDINQSAIITASAKANGLSVSREVEIEQWYAVPVKSVSLPVTKADIFIGHTVELKPNVQPSTADNQALTWHSSNPAIATVNEQGLVTALTAGEVIIRVSSVENAQIKAAEVKLTVKPYIQTYIKLTNEEALKNTMFVVGDEITMNVEYHAGSTNHVIAADEGGIRFWLRHFKSKWIPVKDRVLIDADVLKTESGTSTKTIKLDGVIPTADLPEGQFYQLRASFTSSNGRMVDAIIYPINIVSTVSAK